MTAHSAQQALHQAIALAEGDLASERSRLDAAGTHATCVLTAGDQQLLERAKRPYA